MNEGDIVVLRSGGPKMTVDRIRQSDELVFCKWFDDTNQLHTDHFRTTALKVVEVLDD